MKTDSDKLRPKVGVGVILIKEGMILLGKRKGAHGAGYWATPGGYLEFGETVEGCVIRELAEETGLKALSVRLGPWVNDVINSDMHYLTLFAFIDQFEGTLELLEPNKCEGWEWFELNKLPSPLFPTLTSLIKKMSNDLNPLSIDSSLSNYFIFNRAGIDGHQ